MREEELIKYKAMKNTKLKKTYMEIAEKYEMISKSITILEAHNDGTKVNFKNIIKDMKKNLREEKKKLNWVLYLDK